MAMTKHSTKPHHPKPSPAPPPATVEPSPDSQRPDSWRPPARWYSVVFLVWLGGFLILTLMLFAESLPLLWDLIRLRF
jgi:hypothetical protein